LGTISGKLHKMKCISKTQKMAVSYSRRATYHY
jgi:hypothetical protein